ncbi:hypothetical protein CFOL_v3_27317 [Cephalotus follicularis]|uniref:Uncharacterized protein n=1 Tax=Cephalotus follicularis TaxID=3775 RepID=A0A1Q3CUL3_CEPFO|nr:hypothetical protein CFOL_v3_27317 [Cephalotus follicularis]
MMSPSSRMGDELEFHQRWEFRRGDDDFDSSNDDSRSGSSVELVLRKHTLVSNLIALGNDETNDNSRLQQVDNYNPSIGDSVKSGKVKRRHFKSKKDDLANKEKKRDSHEEGNRKKSKTSVYDPAALDDVKNFVESLLEDLKCKRENMLTWLREEMVKLESDNTSPWPEARDGNTGEQKVQSQHQKTFEHSIQEQPQHTLLQHRGNLKENILVQHQNNFERNVCVEQNVQVQHQKDIETSVHVQNQSKLERNNYTHHTKNFNPGMRAQNCNGGPLERLVKSNKAADSSTYYQPVGAQVSDGQVTGAVTVTEKENGERLALSTKSNLQYSSSEQNAQESHQKSVVLGIRAQNCSGGTSERYAKGKKTANSKHRRQEPEGQVDYGQASKSMPSTAKSKGGSFGSLFQPELTSNPSCQVASSMYSKLPSVLTEPIITNHRLDNPSFNHIQPRIHGNDTSVNPGRACQMINASDHYGYLSGIQPEVKIRSFAQVVSRNRSSFENIPNSSSGSGFQFPLHHGMDAGFSIPSQVSLENLPRENKNTLGLRMNGGAIRFSGGSYNLSDHHVANNLHGNSNYRDDGRLLTFQMPNANNGL